MFWRGEKLVWGVGLLTVTTAVLLDTFLGVVDQDALLSQMGFFYYILVGILMGGGLFWLVGLLRPQLLAQPPTHQTRQFVSLRQPSQNAKTKLPDDKPFDSVSAPIPGASMANEADLHDRKLLLDQIRQNLGPEDVLDLIFDLDIHENDVISPGLDMANIIINVMDHAYREGKMGELALAVERILTPVPPDHLPRLERITIDSPSTILRRYILAYYFLHEVEEMASELGVDWERLGIGSKQTKVRNLLLWLKRRNRLQELIDLMQAKAAAKSD